MPAAPVLGELFARCVAYAVTLHALDVRKETEIPYLAHLLGVCTIVLENGGNEIAAAGAMLHDVAEDHGGERRLDDVRTRFGEDVARIVEDCSDSLVDTSRAAKERWLPRKQRYIEHLAQIASQRDRASSLLVSAADKLYNLRSILADARTIGDAVYERFSGKKFGTLWYYRALLDIYESNGDAAVRRVAADLRDAFRQTAERAGVADATATALLQLHRAHETAPVPSVAADGVAAPA